VAGAFVFSALGLLVSSAIFHTMDPYSASDSATYIRITQAFSTIGTFLVPALLFAYCQDGKWFHYNKADRQPYYLLVNVTLVLSIVILPIVAILNQWNQALTLPESMSGLEEAMKRLEAKSEDILQLLTFNHTYATLAANLLVLALLPAVCEEFLFQGTLQVFISDKSGKPHLAIWLTAFIFSTIHFQFYGFIPRLLLGAYLGYLFYWSRSLWLPILAHFLHNALSILVEFTLAGRGILTDEMEFTQVKGSIPLLISCAVVTFISLAFMWRIQKDYYK
jgi:hypothetical protein